MASWSGGRETKGQGGESRDFQNWGTVKSNQVETYDHGRQPGGNARSLPEHFSI